jgi:hypothetical protein
MARVDGVVGLRMVPGAQRHRIMEDNIVVGLGTASRTWGRCLRGQRCHQLGSGKMAAHKGARPWSRTMARRLWVGLDDGVESSREDSMMTQDLGMSTMAWGLGKFLVGNFGSLTA